MRIAILGATSQIAKDLILLLEANSQHELVLFARRPEAVTQWLTDRHLAKRYAIADYDAFTSDEHFDAILNFVGVGNPAQATAMGAMIFDVTLHFDELALSYIRLNPTCRYIFISSGATYGSNFSTPVDENTKAVIDVNQLQPQDWYGVAKLHAECRHRSLPDLHIVDIRVFNYFSHTQDISARFLITDILRAILDKTVLKTSADFIMRDFIHPSDFSNLVNMILAAPAANTVVDAYSNAPIDKATLLAAMKENFGLQYVIVETGAGVNATGEKSHYYSLNTRAVEFGYYPAFTSLEGVLKEACLILQERTTQESSG